MAAAVAGIQKTFQALGAVLSVTAVISAGKAAKEAYDEQAEASAKLAQVMRNTMGAGQAETKAIEDLIDAQERLGVVAGEVQTEGAQELATYLTMSSSLKTLIPVMNDMVAQQYGLAATTENAVSIATMMGKVMNGQTSALSRYGYSFTAAQEAVLKYGTEAQRAAVLAEVVSESVGGMNQALAATPSGRLQQVKNTLGNIQETFGLAINRLLVLLIPALNTLCSMLERVAVWADKVAQTLVKVFGSGPGSGAASVVTTDAMAESIDGVTASAESATEAVEGLMGFDQINKLPSATAAETEAGSSVAVGGALIDAGGADEAGETLGWLEARLTSLRKKIAALNTSKLTGALGRLKEAAEPLKEDLFSGLSWAMDNVFLPMGTWAVEDGLPAFLGLLTSGCDVLSAAVGRFAPWGKWLWDSFLQPAASWTGDVIVSAMQSISNSLAKISDVLSGDKTFGEFIASLTPAEIALAGIAVALGSIHTTTAAMTGLANITNFITNIQSLGAVKFVGQLAEVFRLTAGGAGTLGEAMTAVFGPGSIIAGIGAVIGGAVTAITSFISMLKNGFSWAKEALMVLGVAIAAVGAIVLGAPAVVAAAIAAIVAGIATAVVVIKDNWESVKNFFINVWSGVSRWFKTAVLDPLVSGFKGFANGIIGFVEGIANGAISGINKLIGALNGISFDIPDWVPEIGGKAFGFNLKEVAKVSLPRLATGSVVPPNNEFAAILGDNKHEPEIVSPVSLMEAAFRNVLQELGALKGGGSPTKVVIPIYVAGRKVSEKVIEDINDITLTTGECPIKV